MGTRTLRFPLLSAALLLGVGFSLFPAFVGTQRSSLVSPRRGARHGARLGLCGLKVDGAVEPLGKFLLVKSAAAEEVTKAGLLLPKSQKPKQGEVVAAGPGEANVESGQMVPMSVKVGEKVLYSKYGGSETIECGGQDHVLVREDDVLLKYKGDDPVLAKISMPRGKVLVKLLPKEQETSFGLLLSEGANEQTTTAGEVVSVGAGTILANGDELEAPVKAGDKVRFRYGNEVELDLGDGGQFSVVSISNCIAKW